MGARWVRTGSGPRNGASCRPTRRPVARASASLGCFRPTRSRRCYTDNERLPHSSCPDCCESRRSYASQYALPGGKATSLVGADFELVRAMVRPGRPAVGASGRGMDEGPSPSESTQENAGPSVRAGAESPGVPRAWTRILRHAASSGRIFREGRCPEVGSAAYPARPERRVGPSDAGPARVVAGPAPSSPPRNARRPIVTNLPLPIVPAALSPGHPHPSTPGVVPFAASGEFCLPRSGGVGPR